MTITLYGMIASPNVFRVALALEEKGLTYTIKDNVLSDDFLKKSRWGLMPCLDIDGQSRAESLAILEWLEDRFPDKPLLPQDVNERSKVRMWMHHIMHELLNNRLTGVFNPGGAAAAREKLKAGLGDVNKELTGRTYVVGDSFTLADLQLAVFYVAFKELNDLIGVRLEDYPAVQAHYVRTTQRPTFVKIDPSEFFAGFVKSLASPEGMKQFGEQRAARMKRWAELQNE